MCECESVCVYICVSVCVCPSVCERVCEHAWFRVCVCGGGREKKRNLKREGGTWYLFVSLHVNYSIV